MNEDQRKHLEFIQSNVTRLSDKSVQIKTFAITLTAGLLAVYASDPKLFLLYVTAMQILFFWFLGGYYLLQERKFRDLYDDIIVQPNSIVLYSIPIKDYRKGVINLLGCIFSITNIVFFGSMFLIIVSVIIILKNSCFV